jgi:hypothetical protein
MRAPEAMALPKESTCKGSLKYMLEVYVDDFVNLVIPTSQEPLWHVANTIMEGISDVFPMDKDESNNSILHKKLLKKDRQYATLKTILGFDFDGVAKHCGWKRAKVRSCL